MEKMKLIFVPCVLFVDAHLPFVPYVWSDCLDVRCLFLFFSFLSFSRFLSCHAEWFGAMVGKGMYGCGVKWT